MSVRTKITIIIIPIMLLAIILTNLAFGIFFQGFILTQETAQVKLIQTSLSSYITEKSNKYLATVNDWSHWDDTNKFANNDNSGYIDGNLTADTFINLDINFIIIKDKDDSTLYCQYFDLNKKEFSEFPINFIKDFDNNNGIFKSEEDRSGIFYFGNKFYILAKSDITDSAKMEKTNGEMIIGRFIDDSLITALKSTTGCSTITINISNNANEGGLQSESENVKLYDISLNEKKDTMLIQVIIPNVYDLNSSVIFSLTKTRDFYISGMKAVNSFALLNTLCSILIAIMVIALLGKYLTKPFANLIKDVKSLDLTQKKFAKIQEDGKDEFYFLRKTINTMLIKIEGEQNKVRENEEKLYATLLSVGDGVITIGTDSKIQFMNPIAQQLTGWSQKDAFGEMIENVFCIVNEYTGLVTENPIKAVFETAEIVQVANHTLLISKDGTERAIEDTAAPIKDKFGEVIGCVLVFRDFSEKKEKQRQIEYLSYHDQLTGLYNRRFFEEALKRLDTKRNLPLSLVYADVNGLKIINDAFGHESGDQTINMIADVFKTECHSDDIIARVGGDEFIILLPNTDMDAAENLIKQIKEKIKLILINDIDISVSFGWYTKKEDNQLANDVLKKAEDLMYQKKILNSASKRNGIIKSILNALLVKCPMEKSHSTRVSTICEDIGKAYHLNEDELKELRTAGELHDIGKIAVDETILNKTSELSKVEWEQIRRHPETGYRLLSATSEFNNIAEYVFEHHERWDGTGYPKGLKGEAVHWKARVIAIADAYDAITSDRPYKKALSEAAAVDEIKKNAGTQFDPDIARVFIEKVLGVEW